MFVSGACGAGTTLGRRVWGHVARELMSKFMLLGENFLSKVHAKGGDPT
jgi:hypothetical protein